MSAPGPESSPTPKRLPPPPLPRTPLVLLGLMTVATLAGPVGIIQTLRGGAESGWPPDRPVEWVALLGITTLVFGLMGGCVAFAAQARRREIAAGRAPAAREARP